MIKLEEKFEIKTFFHFQHSCLLGVQTLEPPPWISYTHWHVNRTTPHWDWEGRDGPWEELLLLLLLW